MSFEKKSGLDFKIFHEYNMNYNKYHKLNVEQTQIDEKNMISKTK